MPAQEAISESSLQLVCQADAQSQWFYDPANARYVWLNQRDKKIFLAIPEDELPQDAEEAQRREKTRIVSMMQEIGASFDMKKLDRALGGRNNVMKALVEHKHGNRNS